MPLANKVLKRSWAIFLGSLLMTSSHLAYALPQNGTVAAGQAGITSSQNQMDVTQSTNRAIINWQSFDIAANERVNFAQPSSSSVTLNRVTGSQNPSQILGALSANGTLMLVNPHGVIFGQGSQVNVGGLVATTSDISDSNFMQGKYVFDRPGDPNAFIRNEGDIKVADGSLAALVGPNVTNTGLIEAKLGKVQMGSGDTFTLDLYGDGLLNLQASNQLTKQLVANKGAIKADGGEILLTAAAAETTINSLINMSGLLQADSVGTKNGHVVLYAEGSNAVQGNVAVNKGTASGKSTVVVSGTINAKGNNSGETGGTVEVVADRVAVKSGATIDASGASGGGTIRVGGDFHGGGTTPTALRTTVQSGATLLANATDNGNGGDVTVWADGSTDFAGTIQARGGANGGNGGFVETSGHDLLNFVGTVDTTAADGQTGTLLLDPANLTISDNISANNDKCVGGTSCNPTGNTSVLNVTDLTNALATNSVLVTTSGAGTQLGNLTVATTVGIRWSTNKNLTLNANGTITVASTSGGIVSSGTGNVTLDAVAGITISNTVSTGGSLTVLNTTSGNITATNGALVAGGSSSFTNGGTGTITLTNANNALTGPVTFTGGGAVSLKNSISTQLASGSNAGGNLIVTSQGDLKEAAGGFTVGGTSSFTSSAGKVTLNDPSNALTGAVALNSNGDATLTNNLPTVLAASTVTGNLAVDDKVGGISQTGVLTVTGTSSFTTDTAGQSIALNSKTNVLGTGVTFTTNGVGGDVFLKNSGDTTLGTSGVGGNLSVEDTTGAISQSGALTVAGTSSFATDAAHKAIALNQTNLLTGAVSLTTHGTSGDASLTNNLATKLAASSVGGNLVVDDKVGGITQNGVLTVTGTSSFTTDTAGQSIALSAPTNALNGAASFTTHGTGGDVSLTNSGNTVLGASSIGGGLTVDETTGGISENGVLTVTGISSFTTDNLTGRTIVLNATNNMNGAVSFTTNGAGGSVSLTNSGTILGASNIGGDFTLLNTTGTITQTAALSVTGNSSFTTSSGAGAITLNAANTFTGTLFFSGNGAVSLTNAASGSTQLLSGSHAGGVLTVSSQGDVTESGPITVSGTSSFTSANGNITLTDGNNALTGAVALNSSNGNSSLTDNVATKLAASTVGGNLTVVDNVGNMTQTGALNVTGTSSFTASAGSITLTNTH